LTFVELAAVGRMKPPELRVGVLLLALGMFLIPVLLLVFVLAADDAGDILLRLFSLKLVLMEEESLDDDDAAAAAAVAGVGGFLTAGPMLEPLELLRLAGTRVRLVDAFELFCSTNGFFGIADVDGFNGIFLTVLVDTALLSEERELLKLVRELLLSTSKRLFGGNDFGRLNVCCCCCCVGSGRLNELVRRGVELALRDTDGGLDVRKDRLLSSDC